MIRVSFRLVASLLALALVTGACRQVRRSVQEAQDGIARTTTPGRAPAASIDDFGPLGSAAQPVLRPQPFNRIVVEVAFTPGRRPNEAALDHMRAVLQNVTGKRVSLAAADIPEGDGSYTSDEIIEIARGRENLSNEPAAALWIGYLDGSFEENDSALGVAVAATAAAIFPDRISSLSSLLQPGGVERAVLVHEIGHLLALVNIGYESHIDHEDPDHPNHSTNRGSVMYWAVEDISVADVFRGGPPDNFDEADRADLERLSRQ